MVKKGYDIKNEYHDIGTNSGTLKKAVCKTADTGYENSVSAKGLAKDALAFLGDSALGAIVMAQVDAIFDRASDGKRMLDQQCR